MKLYFLKKLVSVFKRLVDADALSVTCDGDDNDEDAGALEASTVFRVRRLLLLLARGLDAGAARLLGCATTTDTASAGAFNTKFKIFFTPVVIPNCFISTVFIHRSCGAAGRSSGSPIVDTAGLALKCRCSIPM